MDKEREESINLEISNHDLETFNQIINEAEPTIEEYGALFDDNDDYDELGATLDVAEKLDDCESNIKLTECKYYSHTQNKSGIVKLSFSSNNIAEIAKCNIFLADTVSLMVTLDNKRINLGTFKVDTITTKRNGGSTIKFDSINTIAILDNINKLPVAEDEFLELVIIKEV